MKPAQLVCMFNQDIASGLYNKVPVGGRSPSEAHGVAHGAGAANILPGFGSSGVIPHLDGSTGQRRVREEQLTMWLTNFGGEVKDTLDLHEIHIGNGPMADLCGCVHTPPPHPDQPHESPTTAFRETGSGPELQHRPVFGWGLNRESDVAVKGVV